MESTIEKLVRVRTPFLPNELHFRFHSENDALYVRYGETPLGISEFITPFRAGLTDLDTALGRIRAGKDKDETNKITEQ